MKTLWFAYPFPLLFAAAALSQQPVSLMRDPLVAIARTEVKAVIEDGAATTTIEQVFANRGERPGEAIWLLPVPVGAMADSLKMIVGGKEMAAEVLDARTARAVYEAIVRQRRDPALLEYVGDGLLRARVFPIPPHGEVAVQVRLRQSLPMHRGLGEWSLPLRALRLAENSDGPIAVDVTVRSASALKTVVASRPDAEVIWRGEHEARVAFEIARGAAIERELQILFGLADAEFGLHALHHRRAGEDGWFTMFVSPRRSLADEVLPPRCVQFVVDTSGSMAGPKMLQAKAALQAFLKTLSPRDRFQIVTFATEASPFFTAPRTVDEAALAEARNRVDQLEARGGTNIGDALLCALGGVAPKRSPDELSLVVFVTDGMPTVGVTDSRKLLEEVVGANRTATRVFTFGVGDDVNGTLLADLASELHGTCDFVRNDEPIERKTTTLCARIREPALTDVEVLCDGLERFELTPRVVPDLFAGDTLQLSGRYRGIGTREVVLRGKLAGATKEFRFDVAFPTIETRHDFVPVAWAQRQVSSLLQQIRRGGAQLELVTEVTRLGREFGIATPYTAHLIVEDGMAPPVVGGGGSAPFGPQTPRTGGPASPGPVTGSRGIQIEYSGSDEFYLGSSRRAGAEKASGRSAAVPPRRAAGKTFYCHEEIWVESSLPEEWRKDCMRVVAFSDEYFALLAAHPELREAFALGTSVALRIGETIVLTVTGEGKPADPKPTELKEAAAKSAPAPAPAPAQSPSAGGR